MTFSIHPKMIVQMYKKGYFPMAENSQNKKINFYKKKSYKFRQLF